MKGTLRMKIAVLDTNTVTNGDVSLRAIDALGEVSYYDMLPQSELAAAIGDSDALICNKAQITAELMDKCPNLRYIGLFATGYNNIDIVAAARRGITVCNVPGYSTDSVAQLTFSLILELTCSTSQYNRSVHEGGWVNANKFSYFPFRLTELVGKTLGIFGYGAIGQAVARIGKAFGMHVIVANRTHYDDGAEYVETDELFRRADILTLHCPLNEGTQKLVNRERLALMKETAFLINTSRGGVIDEAALADALNSERIAGAGIDVLTVEPMVENHPFLTAKNCVITPHIAWATLEARTRLIDRVAENICAYVSGSPINTVKS